MLKLNLPEFQHRVRKNSAGKPEIFDAIRKKFVALTPEEWVRQHFIHFLIENGYPKGLMSVENGLQYNQLQKRSDILVYDRSQQPFLLVECKSPSVSIDNSTVFQAFTYNKTLKAPFVALSNGLAHFYFSAKEDGKSLENLPLFV